MTAVAAARRTTERVEYKWIVAAVFVCGMFIDILDTTIVNVALPAIRRSLGASVSELQWTIDAYTLVLASLLILAGSTADRVGRRRIFQIGLVVFSAGSLLCGVAPSLEFLIAARVLQAIGVWGAVFGLSMALGPIVGGALVDSISWRAVFFVNVPIGLVAIALAAVFVPESRAPKPRRLDPVGQILVILTLGTLTYGIIEVPRSGWLSAQTLALFACSALAFVGLIAYERRRIEPLLDLRFFRSIPFSGANTIAVLTFASFGGFLFLNTLYLQDVRGLSPLQAGLYIIPMAALQLVFSVVSGRLVAHRGSRLSLLAGGGAMTAAALMLTVLTPQTSSAYLLGSYALFGAGMGLLNPPITNTAVSGMPGAQAGVAAAIASTSRQVGMTLGVAVIGAVAGGALAGAIAKSFAAATHPGWWIIVVLGVLIIAGGFVSTGAWARATARRTAESLRKRSRPEPVPSRVAAAPEPS